VFSDFDHFLRGGMLYTASEWVIRLVMLIYVPQRRTPSAARTWLLLIFLLPWPGLILYAIFGRPYLPRWRMARQQQAQERTKSLCREFFHHHATRPDLPNQFDRGIALAEKLGDFPISGGNQVELLPNYGGSVERILADLDAAQHHAHLLYYIFADDETGRKVADALSRAARRGVRCRVLVDSLGSKKSRKRLIPWLREAGVEVVEALRFRFHFRPRINARFDLRNHRKIVVIDGRVAYVGSQNLVNADFKPGLVYEELVARVTGPVVLQFQAVFLADRFLETGNGLDEPGLFPQPERPGAAPAQALPSGPGYPMENTQRLLIALVQAARQRVVVTAPYFIPDEPFQEALQNAALSGVEVHLVVSRQMDQLSVGLAQRSYYDCLLEAGVKIHRYKEGFLHAKHVSIDDRAAVIGSSNMDLRSFVLNEEISLVVYDADVVARLRTIQEHYFAGAELLTLKEWRRRSAWVKMAENIARLVDSLL
jgi:cardiolipin synthase